MCSRLQLPALQVFQQVFFETQEPLAQLEENLSDSESPYPSMEYLT
jgi:hypothetical protein